MAANFWNSSHYKQLMEQEEVDVVHALDKERGISVEDFKLIKFHMSNQLTRITCLKSLEIYQKNVFSRGLFSADASLCVSFSDMMKLAQLIKVRQRVVATAVTYMRRVYIRKSMVEFEPRLVALACMYLASKAEESIVQARNVIFCIRKLYPDEYKYELKDLLGMEMKVLEALNYYLVVFHPYRSLSEFLQDAAINDVNMNQITWGIVNDTYKMDLILVHPPYRIALACIYVASVHRERDITAWFEDLHEDMNLVKNIAMEILDFYENYRSITEEKVNLAFSKLALKP